MPTPRLRPRLPDSPPALAPHESAVPSWPGSITSLGASTNGHAIQLYQLGNGPIHLALVGGIHGGAEWNTVSLAYALLDHIAAEPWLAPTELKLSIIPVANPDGLASVAGHAGRVIRREMDFSGKTGRFNANEVDLNRNWACNWAPTAHWQEKTVSGGSAPFSEIETRILRDFFLSSSVDAVIFFHSAAPGVFPGWCDQKFEPSAALARVYADASGYPYAPAFTAYPVTGDAGDWLAVQDIANITVELRNHRDIDWTQNLAGVMALFAYLVSSDK